MAPVGPCAAVPCWLNPTALDGRGGHRTLCLLLILPLPACLQAVVRAEPADGLRGGHAGRALPCIRQRCGVAARGQPGLPLGLTSACRCAAWQWCKVGATTERCRHSGSPSSPPCWCPLLQTTCLACCRCWRPTRPRCRRCWSWGRAACGTGWPRRRARWGWEGATALCTVRSSTSQVGGYLQCIWKVVGHCNACVQHAAGRACSSLHWPATADTPFSSMQAIGRGRPYTSTWA